MTGSIHSRMLPSVFALIALLSPLARGVGGPAAMAVVHATVFGAFALLWAKDAQEGRFVIPARWWGRAVCLLAVVYFARSVTAPNQAAALPRATEALSGLTVMLLALRLAAGSDGRETGRVVRILAAVGLLHALVYVAGSLEPFRFSRMWYTPNVNHLAIYFASCALLAMTGLVELEAASRRAWCAAALAVFVLAVIWTGSRSGVAALLAGTVFCLSRKRKLLFIAPALLVALIVVPNPFSNRLRTMKLDAYSFERVTIWRAAAEMFADHPIAGVGVGQFGIRFPQHAKPLDSALAAARFGKVARHAHNEPLQVAAELGLAGFVPALVLAALLLARGCAVWKRAEPTQAALAGSLLVLAAGAMVSAVVYQPCLVYFGAIAIGFIMAPHSGNMAVTKRMGQPLGRLFAVGCWLGFAFFTGSLIGFPYAAQRSFDKARAAASRGDLNTALAETERAIRLLPCDPEYHEFAGMLILNHLGPRPDLEAYHKVKRHFLTAARLNPNQSRCYRNLAEVERKFFEDFAPASDLFENGEKWYSRATSLDPSNALLLFRSATFQLLAGRSAKGEQMIRKALELEPKFIGGRAYLVTVLRSQQRDKEAREVESELASIRQWAKGFIPMSDFERELLLEPGGKDGKGP